MAQLLIIPERDAGIPEMSGYQTLEIKSYMRYFSRAVCIKKMENTLLETQPIPFNLPPENPLPSITLVLPQNQFGPYLQRFWSFQHKAVV